MAAGNMRDISKQGGLRGMGTPAMFSVAIHVGIAAFALVVGSAPAPAPSPEPIEIMVVSLAPPEPEGGGGGGAAVEEPAPVPAPPAPVVKKARAQVVKAAPIERMPIASKEPAPEEEVVSEVVEEMEAPVELAEAAADQAEVDHLADAVGGQVLLAMAGGTGPGIGFGIGVGHGAGNGKGFGYGDGPPVDVRHAITQPRRLSEFPDNYPMSAIRRGIEGVVRVRLVIGLDGKVEPEYSEVIQSIPALDKAALEAANQTRFSPALDHAGRPMRVIVELPINYRLQ